MKTKSPTIHSGHAIVSKRNANHNLKHLGCPVERSLRQIKFTHDAITAIDNCWKPVMAAVQGACIDGGVDIITACDMRFCTEHAYFFVKEVDLAITVDLGSL
ncbi:Crotonase superfamily [Cynara cardunculus var. scolymus]|uniref:Crotonase superfamily n=1 Tax=Cynara cardunculus var. scolymus TaxID=59895 RepID=A0A103XIM7_CYNCS|nr:Crotonase superfamily [Cynara cardunculus var. scolymus]